MSILFFIFPDMKKIIFTLLFLLAPVFAAGQLSFSKEVYSFGKMLQGETRHIILEGKNSGESPVELETAMTQGVGGKNFNFPKKILPGKSFKIEFDISSEYAEGHVTHTVILVTKEGKTFTATLEGEVEPELLFSEKLLDAGYYAPGEKREWEFYVWKPDGKSKPELKLAKEFASEFNAKFTPVFLNIEKIDEIKEGGKVPGLKVKLSTKGISKENSLPGQKSLRRIVTFESKGNKNAKPEILIIGYWK